MTMKKVILILKLQIVLVLVLLVLVVTTTIPATAITSSETRGLIPPAGSDKIVKILERCHKFLGLTEIKYVKSYIENSSCL